MISHLRGVLLAQDSDGIILECGGVGYGVSMSLHALAKLPPLGETTAIFVYTHVAEESLSLYGFPTASERRLFEILLGTSGVGPKLAVMILSVLLPSDLITAVLREDKSALTRIPGVGNKKAERLLLELKGRLDPIASHFRDGAPGKVSPHAPSLHDDLVSALDNLGFAKPIGERAAAEALLALPACQDLAQLVREALRRTTARS